MKDYRANEKNKPTVQIARKQNVPPGFKKKDLLEKKDGVTIVSPGSCCCPCKALPCECACDVEFNTKQGYPKLGEIVGDGEEESTESQRKREKAERKEARKAAKRERKRLQKEKAAKAKKGNGRRFLHRHLKVHPKTNLLHYEDSTVLMSCGQCESFPCTTKATVLVFRHHNN
jgi:hypothetical protein